MNNCAFCIYVLSTMIITVNRDYIPEQHKFTFVMETCVFFCSTDRILNYYFDELRLRLHTVKYEDGARF
jgi:hypothetical protein